MKRPGPVLVYTSSRLLVFVVAVTVLGLLGMRGILLLAVALLLSGLASYVLLSRQRDAMAAAVAQKASRVRGRMAEATEAEDAADDAARGLSDDPDRPAAEAADDAARGRTDDPDRPA